MTERLSEHGLIAAYFAPLAAPGGFNLRDDAAALTPSAGCDLVMTVDASVSAVHFLPDDDPRDIAHKALAVNVSDLAAKGAEPKGFLLTLGLEDGWKPEWMKAFADELGKAAQSWRCPLFGGDTVRANGALFISITAFGEVPHGAMVRRSGAGIGDRLCVSGTVGDGAMGLFLALGEKPVWAQNLSPPERAFLLERYHRPTPRLGLAPIIRQYASAAMDVSDGLIGDLEKLLSASGVTAEVNLDTVPLSQSVRSALLKDERCLTTIVTGGDDYEILCTIPPDRLDAAKAEALAAGVELHAIGTTTEASVPCRYSSHGKTLDFDRGAFSHF